ncbi:MAG: protein kinase [candidate division Zixibacteria bacterium]|nr:protein kinase [candidate division Zixibacteria bacterium]
MIAQRIGQYEIIEKIGAGGMGEVYLAQDTRLNRKVALKFLAQSYSADAEFKTRFRHEAMAAAALNHPNIVTVYDFGEHEGRSYISMEYVPGRSLEDMIKSGPLSLAEVLDFAIQIVDGLSAAHEAGIVHRDIKPSNIIIDIHGRAKVLDFGLAKISGATKVTREGSTLGTMLYKSPEQARGEEVDHRSDIFSFGCMLYEMITGEPPFTGDYDAAIVYAVAHEAPEPLASKTGAATEGIQTIVSSALEKNPADRYQSCADLLADLEKERDALSAPSRISVLPKVTRKSVFAGLIVGLALIFAGIMYWTDDGGVEPDRLKMLAVLPFENLGSDEDEYFADGITDEITSRLAKLSGLGVISRTSSMQYKDTDKSLKRIGAELGVSYVLEGTILWDKTGDTDRVRIIPQLIQVSDDRHLWSESYQRALTQIFELQAEIAISIANELDVTLLQPERDALAAKPTENLEAYNSYLRALEISRRPNWSRNALQITIELLSKAVKLDPDYALAYALLAEAHTSFYRWGHDRTDERIQLAKAAVETALRLQPDLPEAHLAYGRYHHRCSKDYERSRAALELAAKGLPNDSRVWHYRGGTEVKQGNFKKAIEFGKRGLELSPREPYNALFLGASHHVTRQYDEAVRYYDMCISLAPDLGVGYWHKFFVYTYSQGDLEKARNMLEQNPLIADSPDMLFTLELLERNYAAAIQRIANFPDVSKGAQSYEPRTLTAGLVYRFMGERERALAAFDSAAVMLDSLVDVFPDDHRMHSSLGIAFAGLERSDDALRHGKRALELNPVSKDAFDGPFYEQNMAIIYTLLGDQQAALDKIDYLLSIPSFWMSVGALRVDPVWDSLRDNPRFQALLEKYEN